MFIFKIITVVFFPIIRIAGVPFLTYLPWAFISFILFLGRQRIPKEYFWILVIPPSYYVFHCVLSFTFGDLPLEFKDYVYFAIPIVFFMLIMSFREQSDNDRILKIYYYANIAVVIMSKIPLELTQGLVKTYYNYGMGNIVSAYKYAEIISYRPGGLLLHPAWFGFMIYLLGRYLFLREGKVFYLFLSLVFIVLAGAKGAFFTFFFLEIYFYFKARRTLSMKVIRMFPVIAFIVLLLLLVYKLSPYFHNFISIVMLDISGGQGWSFYSIAYRLKMFGWLFSNWRNFLWGGGVSTAYLQSMGTGYIDSEFVMRILQFGVVGYLLFLSVFVVFYRRAKRAGIVFAADMGEFLLLFMIIGSLSTTLMTNMIFVLFVSMVIGNCERDFALDIKRITAC